MVNVYVNLIRNGKWTIERVPERWRADVQAKLEELSNNG